MAAKINVINAPPAKPNKNKSKGGSNNPFAPQTPTEYIDLNTGLGYSGIPKENQIAVPVKTPSIITPVKNKSSSGSNRNNQQSIAPSLVSNNTGKINIDLSNIPSNALPSAVAQRMSDTSYENIMLRTQEANQFQQNKLRAINAVKTFGYSEYQIATRNKLRAINAVKTFGYSEYQIATRNILQQEAEKGKLITKPYSDRLPYEQRGTNIESRQQYTNEELLAMKFGGGEQKYIDNKITEANAFIEDMAKGLAKDKLPTYQKEYQDYADQLYNQGLQEQEIQRLLDIKQQQLSDRLNNEIKNDVTPIWDSQIQQLNIDIDKATKKRLISETISAIPFEIAGAYATGFVGSSLGLFKGVFGKGVGAYFGGKYIGTTGKDIYQGNYNQAIANTISAATQAVSFGAGMYTQGRFIEKPKIIAAIDRSKTATKFNYDKVDIIISKYGLNEQQAFELRNLINQGRGYRVKVSKLQAANSNDAKLIPKIESHMIEVLDANGNVIEVAGIGKYSVSNKGKTYSRDVLEKAIGKVDGETSTTYVRTFEGKIKNNEFKPVNEIRTLETSNLVNRQRLSATEQQLEFQSESRLLGMGKKLGEESDMFGRLSGGTKAPSEESVSNLLLGKQNQKSSLISKSETNVRERLTEVSRNKLPFYADQQQIGEVGGLLFGAKRIIGTGRSMTKKYLSKKKSSSFKELKEESTITSMPSQRPVIKLKDNLIGISAIEAPSYTGGQSTSTYSQNRFGYNYGQFGSYKENIANLGFTSGATELGMKSFGKEIVSNQPTRVRLGFLQSEDNQTTKPKTIFGFDFRLKRNERTFFNVSTTQDTNQKQEEDVVDLINTRSRQGNKPSFREDNSFRESIGFGQGMKQDQGQRLDVRPKLDLRQRPKIDTGFNFKPDFTYENPPTIVTSQITEEENKTSKEFGYLVFGKRRGKFQQLTSKPTTKERAFGIGKSFADLTLGRTFKLVRTKALVNAPKNKRNLFDVNRYRTFKVKKGKAVELKDTFIQRTKFALSSASEKKEIRQARKGTRSIFGL